MFKMISYFFETPSCCKLCRSVFKKSTSGCFSVNQEYFCSFECLWKSVLHDCELNQYNFDQPRPPLTERRNSSRPR